MSEMSCKTCRRWAAGWCLAQQLGTSRDEVCNAWELSRVVEWEDENEKLQSRIAELEKDLSNKEIEYTDLWDDALALQARIDELEEAQRWRVVADGELPEFGTSILFYDSILERINKGTCTAMNSDNTNLHWFTDDDLFYFGDRSEYITHWMPLPQPPEVQE